MDDQPDDSMHFLPAEGVDGETAWRHLRVVLGCYGLSHEEKVRGAAWLMSLWFTAAIWGEHGQAGDPDTIERLRAVTDA